MDSFGGPSVVTGCCSSYIQHLFLLVPSKSHFHPVLFRPVYISNFRRIVAFVHY